MSISLFFVSCSAVPVKTMITSDPTNATIYLNGKEIGQTPLEATVVQGAGDFNSYNFKAIIDGYANAETTVKEMTIADTAAKVIPERMHFTLEKIEEKDPSAK